MAKLPLRGNKVARRLFCLEAGQELSPQIFARFMTSRALYFCSLHSSSLKQSTVRRVCPSSCLASYFYGLFKSRAAGKACRARQPLASQSDCRRRHAHTSATCKAKKNVHHQQKMPQPQPSAGQIKSTSRPARDKTSVALNVDAHQPHEHVYAPPPP